MLAGAAALVDERLGDRRAAGFAGQHAPDRRLSTQSGPSCRPTASGADAPKPTFDPRNRKVSAGVASGPSGLTANDRTCDF
jgi:hypothetical protein